MKSPRGFTLIELLVVVSIIALLMSILLPALGKAKEQGQRVVCSSNLNQLTTCAIMYGSDFNDAWPYQNAKYSWAVDNFLDPNTPPTNNPSNWVQLLMPTIKVTKIFVCPTVGAQGTAYAPGVRTFDVTYSANGVLTTFGTRAIHRNPSDVGAFKDDGAIQQFSLLRPHWANIAADPSIGSAGWTGYCRNSVGDIMTDQPHNKGSTVGYADAHVEYVKTNNYTSGKFGLTINDQDMVEPFGATYDTAARFAKFTN